MSASQLFKEANGHYVEEEFKKAAALYDQAIKEDPEVANYYLYRASNHIKMENYIDALPDCTKCVELDPDCHKAWQKKGLAYFNLEEYESSLYCFNEAKQGGNKCNLWIKKCKAELKREDKMSGFEPPCSNAEPTPPPPKKTSESQLVSVRHRDYYHSLCKKIEERRCHYYVRRKETSCNNTITRWCNLD